MRVLITGATGGIGAALASAFAAEGAALLLHGRNEALLETLTASLGNDQHRWIRADLTNAQDRRDLIAAADDFGVDTLCNNAGINSFGPFPETDVEALVATNITATLLLTQGLLPHLLAQGRGRIINIGSAFGSIGFPGYAAYCATKFALRGFSEALSRELWDTAVSVHYFAPRATSTAMNSGPADALNSALGVSSDSAASVAAQIIKALHRDARRLQIGRKEALQSRVNALLPGVVDKAIAAQLPIIQKHYTKETCHV